MQTTPVVVAAFAGVNGMMKHITSLVIVVSGCAMLLRRGKPVDKDHDIAAKPLKPCQPHMAKNLASAVNSSISESWRSRKPCPRVLTTYTLSQKNCWHQSFLLFKRGSLSRGPS